jgi:hypothetical protein
VTTVALLAWGLLALCVGALGGAWVMGSVMQARIGELENRLRECNALLRDGRLAVADPARRRRLMLITSNVRNRVQRGK